MRRREGGREGLSVILKEREKSMEVCEGVEMEREAGATLAG